MKDLTSERETKFANVSSYFKLDFPARKSLNKIKICFNL